MSLLKAVFTGKKEIMASCTRLLSSPPTKQHFVLPRYVYLFLSYLTNQCYSRVDKPLFILQIPLCHNWSTLPLLALQRRTNYHHLLACSSVSKGFDCQLCLRVSKMPKKENRAKPAEPGTFMVRFKLFNASISAGFSLQAAQGGMANLFSIIIAL